MRDRHELKPSIVFECDDMAATHATMTANGVYFTQSPTKMPWGPFAKFQDLDGNEFGLRQAATAP
jgi:predicted enzyme related to lactoylglutathione lyase